MLRYYDTAIKNQISKWVLDPNMIVTSPDETRRLFSYRADLTGDKPITLPLIALRRMNDVNILNINKNPLSFDAGILRANNNKVKSLSGVPVNIQYQIDIYTKFFDECDEYVRNFVFKIINNPRLEVEIPYNAEGDKQSHVCNMTLISTITDNSDIPERLVPGQFTRFTLGVEIPDAYLFAVPIRDTWKIDTDLNSALEVKLDTNLDLETDIKYNSKTGIGTSVIEIDDSKII